jgi:homogentisate 1,2-dioxygenase
MEVCITNSSLERRGFLKFLYHHVHRPTQVKEITKSYSVEPKIAIGKNIKSLLLKGFDLNLKMIFWVEAMLVNKDCTIGLTAPKVIARYFYKNADADEMIFIHKGKGKLRTMMGNIPFEYGDYLIIPEGLSIKLILKHQ